MDYRNLSKLSNARESTPKMWIQEAVSKCCCNVCHLGSLSITMK